MVIVKTINGDLLACKEHFIAQQCNCVTVRAHGLSQSIAKKYPYANIYGKRTPIGQRNCALNSATPGTIEICSSTTSQGPNVICMLAQYCPGKPTEYSKYYKSDYKDDASNRLVWFEQCLQEIIDAGITRVAMPYLIGCGLAGGKWSEYSKLLEETSLEIILYKL